VLGGYITGAFHWRYLFLLSIVTLFTIAPFHRHLPEQCCADGRFDVTGALLMAGTVAALLLFITLAVWWVLPVFLVLLVWLVAHIRHRVSPFISPDLFLNRRYRNMIVTGFLAVGSIFGMMFMTPLMLRALNHLGTERIGLVLFPGAMSAAVLGTVGGKLADRKGGVPVVRAGLAFLVLGYVLLSTVTGLSPVTVSLCLIVCYAGFSFLQSSMAHTISSTLPREQMGAGMGMYNMFFFTSGAISAALIGKLLDLSRGRAPMNPFAVDVAGPYSNVYLLLAGVVTIAAVVFVRTFQGAKDESAISKSQIPNPK
jgi:DHA2 family metal-tetracycline-proton antiporter-like MFS transporter